MNSIDFFKNRTFKILFSFSQAMYEKNLPDIGQKLRLFEMTKYFLLAILYLQDWLTDKTIVWTQ